MAQNSFFFPFSFSLSKFIELGAIFQAWNGIVLNVAGCGQQNCNFSFFLRSFEDQMANQAPEKTKRRSNAVS